jgi:glycosyltransferase involved in cell wall biosynthesis
MKALFFIPNLEAGGVQRVALYHINNLRRFRPVLILNTIRGSLVKDLRPDVPVYELSPSRNLDPQIENSPRPHRLARRIRGAVRRILPGGFIVHFLRWARTIQQIAAQERCSIICAHTALQNLSALLAKVFFDPHLRVIAHVHVPRHNSQHTWMSEWRRSDRLLLHWLLRFFYAKADLIVAVSEDVRRDLMEHYKLPAEKIVVIHNPTDVQQIRARAAEPVEHPWCHEPDRPLVVAAGRLVRIKGFELLLEAFARLPEHLGARLLLIGEGGEQPRLQHLMEQLGLQKRVMLLGFQENPWKYMVHADVFVLSSLAEGFPLVIGEALALGLPILATDCSPGMREYLPDGGQYGLLVPPDNVTALAQGLEKLLSDRELRKRLAEQAPRRMETLDLPQIMSAYEAVLERVIGEGYPR